MRPKLFWPLTTSHWPLSRQAQATAEYALLIGVVTAAMLGIQLYAKRGIQAGVKAAADQMSPFADDSRGEVAQAEGMSYETGDRTKRAFAVGFVLANKSSLKTHQAHTSASQMREGGTVTRTIEPGQDVVETSGMLTDCGPGVAQHSEVDCGPGVAQHSEVAVDRRR